MGIKGAFRSDNNPVQCRIKPHDIKRIRCGNAQAAALPDSIVDDTLMAPQNSAIEMNDIAFSAGAGF